MGISAEGCAHPQVVGRAIGEAHAFNPAVGALHFGVPAVRRIVRHLIGQVLPEAQPLGANANAHLHACQKVSMALFVFIVFFWLIYASRSTPMLLKPCS
jgi:hypothetical protein